LKNIDKLICMEKDQFPYVNIRSPAIRAFRTSQGDRDDYTTPRRYRPNSDEVYYDVDWFKR